MKKRTDFNQQKHGVMTRYTLKISFYIPTIEHFFFKIFKSENSWQKSH